LSFPKFGHPAAAWVAIAPLLVAVVRLGPRGFSSTHGWPREAFLLGLATGAVYFGGTLYWVVDTMNTYGGLSLPVARGVAALLVAYLSLYPAAFAAAMRVLVVSFGPMGLLLAPAVWVSTEMGRSYVWDGFPWALLGASQATFLPIAQSASVVGTYGLSFLVVCGSVAAACAVVGRGRTRTAVPAGILLSVVLVAAWGWARLEASALTREGAPVTVGVVQGNFSQDMKWDPAMEGSIVSRYLRLTAEAASRGATFVLWPESSVPFYFQASPVKAAPIREAARRLRVSLLIGGDEMEAAPAGAAVRAYNSAFLIGPDGEVAATYRKVHLVPFGEYVPLQSLLSFVKPLVQAVSSYSPGQRAVVFDVDGGRSSTAICYEVVYPSLMRRFVLSGSELLTTITNDAWFGRSSAAYQHFEQASLRAVEEGRYLVRAANTGVSGVVDPYGRVLDRTALFETAVFAREVRFLRGRTIYARLGDVAGYLSLALTAAALGAVWRQRGGAKPH
jgi:apolipoprotein N-acyltransferase